MSVPGVNQGHGRAGWRAGKLFYLFLAPKSRRDQFNQGRNLAALEA
jgi:hypothetical protein